METTASKFARRYDREFKENAVALVTGGKTITEVARDLGVSHWSLNRWVHIAREGRGQSQVGTVAMESCEQREMRRQRLQQVSRGEFCMVSDWICAADFQLYPHPSPGCDFLKHGVRLRRIAKPLLQFGCHNLYLCLAGPEPCGQRILKSS
jgi:transposase-like protein